MINLMARRHRHLMPVVALIVSTLHGAKAMENVMHMDSDDTAIMAPLLRGHRQEEATAANQNDHQKNGPRNPLKECDQGSSDGFCDEGLCVPRKTASSPGRGASVLGGGPKKEQRLSFEGQHLHDHRNLLQDDDPTSPHLVEREVLMKLFEATGGEKWLRNEGWLEGDGGNTAHCSWHGVECSEQCHLKETWLNWNNLVGALPTEIGKLTGLEHLLLEGNGLVGALPTEIGKLTELKDLDLGGNSLTGTLPTELGAMEKLSSLAMHGNSLAGATPTEFGKPKDLWHLSLGWNSLNGTPSTETGEMSALFALQLSYNILSGTTPPEFGKLTGLVELDIGWNQLTGTLPTEPGETSEPCVLGLSNNNLTGTMPPEFGKLMTFLGALEIGWNRLTGTPPTEIGKPMCLQVSLLHANNLTGTAPTEIGELANLGWLQLSGNSLNGVIPLELGKVNLFHLELDSNRLTGRTPTEIVKPPELAALSLTVDKLNGTMPTEFGGIASLKQLHLNENILIGTTPTEIALLVNLKELALWDNALSGRIPGALGNIAGTKKLNFSHNSFSEFPFSEKWPHLHSLDLSHNKIQQTIPADLEGLNFTEELLLSGNSISGSIPSQIGSLSRLERLHLDNNRLSGAFPDKLLFLWRLVELNLSNNTGDNCFDPTATDCGFDCTAVKRHCCEEMCVEEGGAICAPNFAKMCLIGTGLWGELPARVVNSPNLKLLDLSSDTLVGTIMPEISQLSRLDHLDIANNDFRGTTPSQLGALTAATVRLSGNDLFVGDDGLPLVTVPLGLCAVPGFDMRNDSHWCPPERNAQKGIYDSANGQAWTNASGWVGEHNNHCSWHGVLCRGGKVFSPQLSNNGLSGRISTSIGKLNFLEVLDFHDDDLQGSIPSQVGELSHLSYARFSYNAITGSIPSGLASLRKLELLHLHSNRTTGDATFSFPTTNHSVLVADCGSPSDFEPPFKCPNCTMCCNSIGECHKRKEPNYVDVAFIVVGSVAGFFVIVALVLKFWNHGDHQNAGVEQPSSSDIMQAKEKKTTASASVQVTETEPTRSAPIQATETQPTYELPESAWKAVGEESVYCFMLSESRLGWTVSFITVFAQAATFFLFVEAAELDFGDESKDWVYSWRCPRNKDVCEDTGDDLLYGWIVFVILMTVHILPDLINGLKLLLISTFTKDEKDSFWKLFRCFLSGLSLFLITVLALYASIVYNIATARSNTELMINAVVVLFVNDLDEQLFALLK